VRAPRKNRPIPVAGSDHGAARPTPRAVKVRIAHPFTLEDDMPNPIVTVDHEVGPPLDFIEMLDAMREEELLFLALLAPQLFMLY